MRVLPNTSFSQSGARGVRALMQKSNATITAVAEGGFRTPQSFAKQAITKAETQRGKIIAKSLRITPFNRRLKLKIPASTGQPIIQGTKQPRGLGPSPRAVAITGASEFRKCLVLFGKHNAAYKVLKARILAKENRLRLALGGQDKGVAIRLRADLEKLGAQLCDVAQLRARTAARCRRGQLKQWLAKEQIQAEKRGDTTGAQILQQTAMNLDKANPNAMFQQNVPMAAEDVGSAPKAAILGVGTLVLARGLGDADLGGPIDDFFSENGDQLLDQAVGLMDKIVSSNTAGKVRVTTPPPPPPPTPTGSGLGTALLVGGGILALGLVFVALS